MDVQRSWDHGFSSQRGILVEHQLLGIGIIGYLGYYGSIRRE